MSPSLLRTLAKFADGSFAIRAADKLLGSPAYDLGKGDAEGVPASNIIAHSIVPNLVRLGVGTGLGYGAGELLPDVLENYNVIEPEAGEADPTPDSPALLDAMWSEQIRNKAPMAGAFTGSTLATSLGRPDDFMQGIRDAMEARKTVAGPWDGQTPGTSDIYVPWKVRP
jgi:hypothetical protein